MVESAARQAGRDPSALGMEGRVSWGDKTVDKLVEQVGRWRSAGASHVSVNTMGRGLATVDDHLRVLRDIARSLDLAPCRGRPRRLDGPVSPVTAAVQA